MMIPKRWLESQLIELGSVLETEYTGSKTGSTCAAHQYTCSISSNLHSSLKTLQVPGSSLATVGRAYVKGINAVRLARDMIRGSGL
jgi:hypothetical protein